MPSRRLTINIVQVKHMVNLNILGVVTALHDIRG